jgi:tetratricopeptide (TPR) repeat protein
MPPPAGEDVAAVDAARVALADADASMTAGRFQAAKTNVAEARLDITGIDYPPIMAEVLQAEARILYHFGEYAEAEVIGTRALELALHRRDWQRAQQTALLLMRIVGDVQGRSIEAIQRYRLLAEQLASDDPGERAFLAEVVAAVHDAAGQHDASERAQRQALQLWTEHHGESHYETALARAHFGAMLLDHEKPAEAEREIRQAIEVLESELGSEHPTVAKTRHNLALAAARQGKLDDAEASFRSAAATLEATFGPEHPDLAMIHRNTAEVLQAKGDHERALSEAQRAVELWSKTTGEDSVQAAIGHDILASVLSDMKRYDEAEAEHRRALAIREATYGPDHLETAYTLNNLSLALFGQGNLEEAESLQRRALEIKIQTLGPDDPSIAGARENLANTLAARGKNDEALKLYDALGPDFATQAQAVRAAMAH